MTEPRRYEIYGQAFQATAHATYAEMRAHDPVLRQPGIDGSTPIWFLTRHDDVERMLTDESSFSRDPSRAGRTIPMSPTERLLTDHMLNASGDRHRRLRTLVQQAFTPKRVRELRPFVQGLADRLLAERAPYGRMDVIADYAFPLPIRVILELLGVPDEDRERFRAWSDVVVTPALTDEAQADARGKFEAFIAYLGDLFERRRAEPRDDLISALLAAEAEGDRLTTAELYGTVVLLIVAGHETTVNLIANGLLALHRHPEARATFEAAVHRGDRDEIAAFVEEAVRYDGPVSRALNRWAIRDVTVGGRTIRRGEPVIGVLAAANRDPERFDEPDAFVPGRPEAKAHLGFGKGIHYCLGAPLARLEGEIALATFARALPDWRLELPEGGVPTYRPQPSFRSIEALEARW